MDIEKLTKDVILQNMTPEQQKAVLDSVMASVQESKKARTQKVAENVDLVMQALKKIEAKMLDRVSQAADKVEAVASNVKDGKDGRDGKDGKDGKQGIQGPKGADGRNGVDGKDGKDGRDGVDGVSVVDAFLDFDNSLVIELSNGKQINVGAVLSDQTAEKVQIVANGGAAQPLLDAIAALQAEIANLIPDQTGNAGKFLTTNGSVLSWAGGGGGLVYQGTWNASTNSPTLVSSTGVNGYYYVVGVSGSTNLDGTTDWVLGDWVIFNGTTWQKIDNTDLVTSVAGRTGAITLTSSDVGLGNVENKSSATIRSEITSSNVTTALGYTPYNSTNPSGYTSNTGTVTSVGGTGTVNGLSLSGTVTSSGNLTLGGTLDLSSPPAIGGSTAAAGTFTTLTANSTFQAGKSSANYQQEVGAATGLAPVHSVQGSDTNISQVFQSKGTGAIDLAAGSSGVNISNGGTVTAITRTAVGSGYTSIPSVAISAPTTAGGVQATATAQMYTYAATVQSGGSGYTLNDVITVVGGTPNGSAATYTVTGVTGGVVTAVTVLLASSYTALPTNPASTTGGTGTGCTLNLLYSLHTAFTITNAGSGYVEQPTVSFSGGGGSGAAAYATVGSGTVVRSLGNVIDFYTPNQQIAFRISDYSGSSATGYWTAYGGSASPLLRAVGTISAQIQTSSAVPIQFVTSASTGQFEQLRVAHTASAVNYVQVTGAATTGAPTISVQGSDSAISLNYSSKGTYSSHIFTGTQGNQFQITGPADGTNSANRFIVYGGKTGAAPILGAVGSDTNIDLALTPKGTGKVTTSADVNAANFVASSGVYAKTTMSATYTDGIVLDYLTGNGRISVGSADTLTFYNGGVANTQLAQLDTKGNLQISGGIYVNSQTISANYTIPVGSSGHSAGPITVSSGVSVTISSGSKWVVL